MKSITVTLLSLVVSITVFSQYYYKDILGSQETAALMKQYKAQKVVSVTATGFDGDNKKTTQFGETHHVLGNRLKISTRNGKEVTNQYFSFNDQGLLTAVNDTLGKMTSATTYTYDDKNRLTLITNTVSDEKDSLYVNESHVWMYNDDGKPVKMLVIVNVKDTTEVRFALDEKGNVGDELSYKKYRPDQNIYYERETIYYYYNDNKNLTDVVRYNKTLKKLMPDFIFIYSESGQLLQKRTTLGDRGLVYLNWRYFYNDKGLKIRETTINRDGFQTGRIDYSYRYAE